jgi:hypothetical protein
MQPKFLTAILWCILKESTPPSIIIVRFVTKQPYFFLGAFVKLLKASISFVISVCVSVRPSAWNNSASIGGSLMKCCR